MIASRPHAAAGLALLPLVACAHGSGRVDVSRPPEPLQIVAVLPVAIRFPGRPGEDERQTLVLLDQLWRGSTWSVLTPDEFRVLEPATTDLRRATNLVVVSHQLGLDPSRFGVLRAAVTVREARGQAVVAGGGQVAIGHDYQGTIEVLLELRGAAGQPVATVSATADIDPFAELPEHDDAPWIRRALTTATTALVAACTGCVVDAPRIPLPLTANPASAYRRLEAATPATDPLGRQQQSWRFYQFFDPDCSVRDAERLLALGDSVCVGATAELPLLPGDCITAVDGERYRSPHSLVRALARSPRGTLDVVDRHGTHRQVNADDLPH